MNAQDNTGNGKNPLPETESPRKLSSGITGLDEILEGGIPRKRVTLVSGGPGTGKTVFGLEILHHWAQAGEPVIFITFEERADAVRRNVASFGWDLGLLEQQGKFFLMEARMDPKIAISGDFNLTGLLSIVEGKARAMGARLIVIDAVDMLLYHYDTPGRRRSEVYALNNWLTDRDFTAVITVKTSSRPDGYAQYEFMDFMADCVVHLYHQASEETTSKRLRVIKYRGSDFGKNTYTYSITSNGVDFIPISSVALEYKPLGGKITSGNPKLDDLLHGGFRRGSTILLAGTTGTGKTTTACTFVRSACECGEKVLYIGFEESQAAMVDAMLSPGIDLRPALASGLLRIICDMPESVGTERHLIETFQTLEMFEPRHIILDAISACKRMGHERSAFDYLVRLVNFCKHRGITCFMINQTASFRELEDVSGIGVSSLMDAIVFLRFWEDNWALRRILLILKARGSVHSDRYHEFRITDQGIDIIEPFGGRDPADANGGEK